MKLITRVFIFALPALFIFSCKKEGSGRHCWAIVDNVGNQLSRICNKTENELVKCVTDGTCINYSGGGGLTACSYYMDEGEKFCWLINNHFVKDINESQVNFYRRCYPYYQGAVPQKVACDYCQNWYNREKNIYKPTNTVSYSPVRRELYCGDTAKTIYQGRQIIRKDDADSLIIIQFSNNSINW